MAVTIRKLKSLLALILCACLGACGSPHASHITVTSENESVAADTEPSDKDLIEVVWPENLIAMTVLDIDHGVSNVYFRAHEEKACAVDDSDLYVRVKFTDYEGPSQLIRNMHEKDDEGLFSAITENKDGTITVSMTAEEYEKTVALLHNRFNESIEAFQDQTLFAAIEYEKDYSEIRLYAGKETFSLGDDFPSWNKVFYCLHNAGMLRLYESKDGGEASVRVQVFDHDTGKLLGETIVPDGELVLPLSGERRSE